MKVFILIIISLIISDLNSLQIVVDNDAFIIGEKDAYTITKTDSRSIFSDIEGSPSIPLKEVFFEIPPGKTIKSVEIETRNIEITHLQKQLYPIQKALPLSSNSIITFTEPNREFYENIYPQDMLYSFDSGQLGSRKIGFVSFYTMSYHSEDNLLEIPSEFELQIQFMNDRQDDDFPDNYVTKKVLQNLDLPFRDEEFEIKYLLITPQQFLDEYQDLLDWRKIQGVRTFVETIENIENEQTGIDLQEKIRNFIIEMYLAEQISFVTLGADVYYIPDRKTFAFDCEFGGNQNENDIPADMYYSCLNGSWDDDQNQVYGEETDDVDYFPEVFVGRIPANSGEEIASYISALIEYESGNHPDYNKAAGFSMELWDGSDSEVCQQYIYENYFPEYYDINFIYNEENTTENAYALLNADQNIVQHTGHAGITTLSLEDGRIQNSNLELLDNDYGGMLYSIGCWSAAIDNNSIGENLVIAIDKGLLGYVGNSRYGWGAPSASGFGFSEFYQKEFFKNLFRNQETIITEGNAIQKIPFIPYYSGTSVYKWVAYELNSLGDSYFRLLTNNPMDFEYSINILDSIIVNVSVDDDPMQNVIITKGDFKSKTDLNGNAKLPNNGLDENISLYKYGYRIKQIPSNEVVNYPQIENITGNEQTYYLQGEDLTINSYFNNPTFISYDFYVIYDYNDEEIEMQSSENAGHIEDFSIIQLPQMEIRIKPVADSFQMENGKEIIIREKIFNAENDTLITQTAVSIYIKAPNLEITNLTYDDHIISPGSNIPFGFQVRNTGLADAFGLELSLDSANLSFEKLTENLWIVIPPGETFLLENSLYLPTGTQEDFICHFNIDMKTTNLTQDHSFSEEIMLPVGTIGISEDFEDGFEETANWEYPEEWQIVSTYAESGENSFSCRPEQIGAYSAESPSIVYLPGSELSFQYKYKMPMYGEDGVYFIMDHDTISDTLLFLGAGGALLSDIGRPDPEVYIESDWAEYSLEMDEILLDAPSVGTMFNVRLVFNFSEEIEGFNQYSLMEDIGVFFDDLTINKQQENIENVEDSLYSESFRIFPNPVRSAKDLKFSLNLLEKDRVKINIYNIKGQFIRTISDRIFSEGEYFFFWNGKDSSNRQVNSGVYFVRSETGSKISTRKFLLLK